ncbi:hypothetical protein THOM_1276 [Trachipleistophora hominis]|uniref:Uncharacterized protein n=1 Tax=Trachipleistophora hominis TaxID=72359 RepID=L7JWA7_TRAHO|nr:hypothetical protein THOM_1276 [Trachipleistophora hominis]
MPYKRGYSPTPPQFLKIIIFCVFFSTCIVTSVLIWTSIKGSHVFSSTHPSDEETKFLCDSEVNGKMIDLGFEAPKNNYYGCTNDENTDEYYNTCLKAAKVPAMNEERKVQTILFGGRDLKVETKLEYNIPNPLDEVQYDVKDRKLNTFKESESNDVLCEGYDTSTSVSYIPKRYPEGNNWYNGVYSINIKPSNGLIREDYELNSDTTEKLTTTTKTDSQIDSQIVLPIEHSRNSFENTNETLPTEFYFTLTYTECGFLNNSECFSDIDLSDCFVEHDSNLPAEKSLTEFENANDTYKPVQYDSHNTGSPARKMDSTNLPPGKTRNKLSIWQRFKAFIYKFFSRIRLFTKFVRQ